MSRPVTNALVTDSVNLLTNGHLLRTSRRVGVAAAVLPRRRHAQRPLSRQLRGLLVVLMSLSPVPRSQQDGVRVACRLLPERAVSGAWRVMLHRSSNAGESVVLAVFTRERSAQ